MKSSEALRDLAGRGSWQDTVSRYRERYGRHASREIARRYGVTQRTVQRAMKGETRSPKFAQTDKWRADRAADAVRNISIAHAGHVQVSYEGHDQGPRYIGDVQFGPEDLNKVIEALERENFEDAGDAMDAAILDQYEGGLGDVLTIDDYTDGLTFD